VALTKSVRGFIKHNDLRLMRRVHRWPAPRWLRHGTVLISRLGDGWVWYALGLIILFIGGEKRFLAFFTGLTASLMCIVIFKQLKRLSKRPRPCQIEPHCWAMISPPDQFSFPSGHAMTSFAIAICLGYVYPQMQIPLLLLALSIAASRIILGMHFLTDVIVGSILGAVLGYFSLFAFGLL